MSCAIPMDLDSHWFLSDVVLLAENAKGRELHLLSAASPVFRAMFSSSFAEGTEDRIKISSDYDTLLKVLRFIHHSCCQCLTTKFDKESLLSMYMVADMWDLPIVRKKVLQMANTKRELEEILEMFGEEEGGNIPCDIPQNFESPWILSDAEVVSRDGDRFYVSTALLSLGSSCLRDQFLEQKSTSVEVPIPSDTLKEILHRMHHIYCDCSPEATDLNTRLHLHLAANWLKVPRIKRQGLARLDRLPKVLKEETERFIQGNKTSLISVFQKIDFECIRSFLYIDDTDRPLFSKKDLALLFKRNAGEMMQKHAKKEYFKVYDIFGVDLNKPYSLFNVMVKTRGGKRLYARKQALIRDSKFFAKKFLVKDWSEGRTPEGQEIITVDLEYPIMHRILSVIHGCHKAIEFLNPSLLFEIYQAASEERLDIPKIRKLCRKHADDCADNKIALFPELSIILQCFEEIEALYELMGLKKCVDGSYRTYSTCKDGKDIFLDGVSLDEHVFSSKNIRKALIFS